MIDFKNDLLPGNELHSALGNLGCRIAQGERTAGYGVLRHTAAG